MMLLDPDDDYQSLSVPRTNTLMYSGLVSYFAAVLRLSLYCSHLILNQLQSFGAWHMGKHCRGWKIPGLSFKHSFLSNGLLSTLAVPVHMCLAAGGFFACFVTFSLVCTHCVLISSHTLLPASPSAFPLTFTSCFTRMSVKRKSLERTSTYSVKTHTTAF